MDRDSQPRADALIAGTAWREFCAELKRGERLARLDADPKDGSSEPDVRSLAEGYRYLARYLAAGLGICLTHDDPDYPMLRRMIEYGTPWGLDHPDCLYLYAPLRGGTSYTLFGRRGSANVFDLQVNAGHFSEGTIEAVQTRAVLDGGDLIADKDGNFTLSIGGNPADHANAIPLADDARFLQIRQYFADWETERPADLILERDDAAWPIPPPRPELVGRQLSTLKDWIDKAGDHWQALSRRFLSMPENSLHCHFVTGDSVHGALAGQVYGMGNFACPQGAAVIVEFDTPPCAHWNVSLSNRWWECVEYASRQSSLNQSQAVADPDGKVRCVIAHRDPGVTNWLDPGGNDRGTLALRMHRAEAEPRIRIERVPLDRLDSTLPADTPRIGPDERKQRLTRRRHAVLRRFRL